MLLGFAAFAELPFSTASVDNSVTIPASANTLAISIGSPGISADSVIETITGNELTLGFGELTITGDANVAGVKNELVLGTGTVTATGDTNITAVKNALVISSGTVTITGTANVIPTGGALTLATGNIAAITWSEIQPGATMTWTPIDPTA
tara:strand:- start:183 stop:635 length:453 start_codon:yes stop_codon:yes gene_type:complete